MTAGEPNGNARWQTFAAVAGVALLLLGGLLTMFGQLTALSSEVSAMQRSLETHEKQLDRVPDLRERLAHLDIALDATATPAQRLGAALSAASGVHDRVSTSH